MNKKGVNIIFKTKSFPNISETFVVANIVDAINKGYAVTIITDKLQTLEKTSQLELFKKYGLLEKTVSFKTPTSSNRKVKALQLLLHPQKLYYFLKLVQLRKKKSFDAIFRIHFYWKFRNTKIVHVHFATALAPLLELKKIGLLKSKIIVTFHGYDAHFLPDRNKLELLIKDYHKYVAQITVNSAYLKDKLITKGFRESLIKIIPIGYSRELFKINKHKKRISTPFKIISVGRLVTLKGHYFGIKAISKLLKKEIDVSYTIVGEGPEFENLNKLILDLGLSKNIFLTGKKNQQEIKELFENSKLFLMTSTIDEHGRREAFGVVSLEAQAMGLPIVGFDSGGFPDTIIDGKTGF